MRYTHGRACHRCLLQLDHNFHHVGFDHLQFSNLQRVLVIFGRGCLNQQHIFRVPIVVVPAHPDAFLCCKARSRRVTSGSGAPMNQLMCLNSTSLKVSLGSTASISSSFVFFSFSPSLSATSSPQPEEKTNKTERVSKSAKRFIPDITSNGSLDDVHTSNRGLFGAGADSLSPQASSQPDLTSAKL